MKNQPTKPSETKDSTNPNKNRGNKGRRFSAPRPPRIFWKSLLTNKAFDLFIVVAGVSIAFQLNAWKVSSDQRSVEKFYIEHLQTDLTKDIEELDKGLKELQSDYQSVVGYLEEYGRQSSVGDSLGNVISSILTLDTFERNENTYSSMMSEKSFNVLSDPALRAKVTEYYNQYNSIQRFEDRYTEAIIHFNNYFTPYCDYTFHKVVDKSVLSKVQTKNNLLLAASQLEDGIESYEEALTKAKELKKILE